MKDRLVRKQLGIETKYDFAGVRWTKEPSPTIYEQLEAIKEYLGIRIIKKPTSIEVLKIEKEE